MFMAIDQYGQTFHGLTHPRKDLLETFGRQHAQKMYVDTDTGTKHVGYVIAGHWLTLYHVTRYERTAP